LPLSPERDSCRSIASLTGSVCRVHAPTSVPSDRRITVGGSAWLTNQSFPAATLSGDVQPDAVLRELQCGRLPTPLDPAQNDASVSSREPHGRRPWGARTVSTPSTQVRRPLQHTRERSARRRPLT
jgi:hypothetical protein